MLIKKLKTVNTLHFSVSVSLFVHQFVIISVTEIDDDRVLSFHVYLMSPLKVRDYPPNGITSD